MMSYIFAFMMFFSVVFAVLRGNVPALSAAIIGEPVNAIALVIKLAGGMCFWSGIMEIAEKSGLNGQLTKLFLPITSRLFKNLKPNGTAMKTITMNIVANLLGLGNAATPLGIKGIMEIEKEERSGQNATNNMVMFVVLNTASIQLIPTTVLLLRQQYGSSSPAEIITSVWITSCFSAGCALAAAKIFSLFFKGEK